jgi:tetratricopeptide (TPR) repeat protein
LKNSRLQFIAILVFIISLASCHNTLSGKIEQARLLAHQGQFAQALSIYAEVASKDRSGKHFSTAMHETGDIYINFLSDDGQALRAYSQLFSYSSNQDEQLYALKQIAWIYQYRVKDYNGAIIAYSKILKLFGERKDVMIYRLDMGDCYKELGDFSQAITEYRGFLNSLSTNDQNNKFAPRAYYEIGNCYYFMDQYPEALENYVIVSTNYPNTIYSIRSRFWEASCLESMGQYKDAIAVYQEIKDKYPNPEVVEQKIQRIQKLLKSR